MPNVPGTKVWLRKEELDVVCQLIEDTPPAGRLIIAYEFALGNVRRSKQALSNIKTVKDYVIRYWFNFGYHDFPYGKPTPLSFEER